MRRRIVPSFAVCLLAVAARGETICDSLIRTDVKPGEYERLTEKAKRGVTHLAGSGSGFFITEDGYFITNEHVVRGASEIVVVHGTNAYLVDVVRRSGKTDLALLKVNLLPPVTNGVVTLGVRPTVPHLPFAVRCDVGETVYVVGFPETEILGHEPKFTQGIVNSASGYRDRSDLLQVDATITHGNSGGPVVNVYGEALGVACAGVGLKGGNFNYAIRYDAVRKFLGNRVHVPRSDRMRQFPVARLARQTIAATGLVLVYHPGAYERIVTTEVNEDESAERERVTRLRKALLDARICKVRREWSDLKDITEAILADCGEYEDAREMNEIARDELGLHLTVVAEVEGRDVEAVVVPVQGFRESHVSCGRPTALWGGQRRKGFPVEARLSFSEGDKTWRGELKTVYDWSGTKEMRVVLRRAQ